MDEIDRARRVLHGVDGELDTDHTLDRVRALQRAEPGPTVLIPITEEVATRRPRRRPAFAAALVTACLAAVTALAVGVGSPWRDDTGPIQPGASATATHTPETARPSPVDERTLLRMIAAATMDMCLDASPRGDDKEYLIRLDDGTWTFAAETTRTRSLDTTAKVDELVLSELAQQVTQPGDHRTTSRETASGSLRVDVVLGADSDLTDLVLFVDPVSWRPTTVTGRTTAGTQTTIDVSWRPQCPRPDQSDR